ncbi:MAG: acyl-CoA dehydrogenase family protein, partial [Actinobacteria bacterium]|nr:acyl-CoA dehydrogenase family protein [Actinomycetota bacterium]
PRLADGSAAATLSLTPDDLTVARDDTGVRFTGVVPAMLAAGDADLILLGGRDGDGAEVWTVVRRDEVDVRERDSLDLTRPVCEVSVDLTVGQDRLLTGLGPDAVRGAAVAVLAAEAAGVAAWCQETATEHAKVRRQFGRPIGQFQAVKHGCADLLVLVEQVRAAAWDAARALATSDDPDQRALATAVAGATAFDAAVSCALECIQILGGIGFTWEHDAHLYLRRATAVRQLLGGTSVWRDRVCGLALAGARRELSVELGDLADVDGLREEVRAFLDDLPEDPTDRRAALADSGYHRPHWPEPWGRDAGPVEQLVIEEQFTTAGVERPDLVIGDWILPTIIAHGSDEQRERFIRPTLRGEITWCQMFSEPEAGSDLAALSTRAERTDGGWVLTGQKVWTSLARSADHALCLARTDPDVPKHEGITAFLVDMDADGLDVRPLRELTGNDMFNEIFLDGVLVPDEDVLGPVNEGWEVGRTTLANERVAMSSGSSMGSGVERTIGLIAEHGDPEDPVLRDRLGALICGGQVLSLLGFRTTLRQVSGVEPGASASVRKLVGGLHAQDCAELAVDALGPLGATAEGPAAKATYAFLQTQCLTIAGGTTAVQKNVIAERILGLPRDDAAPDGDG